MIPLASGSVGLPITLHVVLVRRVLEAKEPIVSMNDI